LLSVDDFIQSVAEAVTYNRRIKCKRRISISSAGSEPAIPEVNQLLTYVVHRTVNRIGTLHYKANEIDTNIYQFVKKMTEIDAQIAVSISDSE
jgi:hypothetical protein